jgi:hypothetical protein
MTLPTLSHVDLFSAGINALIGLIVARDPSHNRGYAVGGLMMIAFFGGIGIAVPTAIVFRVLAVRDHWKQIVPVAAPGEDPRA